MKKASAMAQVGTPVPLAWVDKAAWALTPTATLSLSTNARRRKRQCKCSLYNRILFLSRRETSSSFLQNFQRHGNQQHLHLIAQLTYTTSFERISANSDLNPGAEALGFELGRKSESLTRNKRHLKKLLDLVSCQKNRKSTMLPQPAPELASSVPVQPWHSLVGCSA